MNIKIYIFLLTIIFISNEVIAQSFKKNRVGYSVNVGISTYVGELANNLQTFTFNPNLGLGIAYRLNSILSARGELSIFKLSGGSYSKFHSLSFVSNNAELSGTIVYNILPEKKSFKYRNGFSPFLFVGVGLTTYKTKIFQEGKNPDFRIINEGSSINATPVIPFGAGVKIKTSAFTDVIVEIGYRKTFTRTLDNVRPQFISNQEVQNSSSGDIAPQETRIKNSHTDGYFVTSIKIVYTPNQIFKKKIRSATPQSKWISKKNKATSIQISKNKKLASDKVTRLAANQ